MSTATAKRSAAAQPAIPAEDAGIAVIKKADMFHISFPYDRRLVGMMRGLDAAKFDKEAGNWTVPATAGEHLSTLVASMRKEATAISAALADIRELATKAALQIQQENGAEAGVEPQISDFHEKHKDVTGKIVASNSHYVAQFTGTGNLDGAAFMVLHRRDDLDVQLFNGDRAVIRYGDKGQASAKKYLNAQERDALFDKNLGASLDGVKVTERDGKYLVEFDYNEALSDRMRKIDGAAFNKDIKVWEVGAQQKSFLARAVQDMRNEVVADKHDREALHAVAADKISGVKVLDAYDKKGQSYTGEVLSQNSRYVLQHTGKEYAVLHRQKALGGQQVRDGQNVRVEYDDHGKANVTDRSQSKSKGIER